MAVDVVIPLFNGQPWIEETLAGVFAQTATLGEVVVVDDASTDDGPERVRRFGARVRLIPSMGKTRTRQTGLLATMRPLVAFADQDDVWHARHLEGLLDVLDRAPEAPAAASSTIPFRRGDRPVHRMRRGPLERVDPWATWPFACPIETPSAVLFRRTPLLEAGGWELDAAPDWQAYLRIAQSTPIVRTRSATCAYRVHPAAQSTLKRRDGLAHLAMLSRAIDASLEYRMARERDEGMCALLQRRHDGFRQYEAFLRAVDRGDGREARRAAYALEESFAPESGTYVLQIIKHAIYLFCPDDDREEFRRLRGAFLDRIADAVPEDAPRTHRAFVRNPLQRPFRWRRVLRHVVKGQWPSAVRLIEQRQVEIEDSRD